MNKPHLQYFKLERPTLQGVGLVTVSTKRMPGLYHLPYDEQSMGPVFDGRSKVYVLGEIKDDKFAVYRRVLDKAW